MVKKFEDRLVGICVKRMERLVKKGVLISEMGVDVQFDLVKEKMVVLDQTDPRVCAKKVLMLHESFNPNLDWDRVTSLGLTNRTLRKIEDGFMDDHNLDYFKEDDVYYQIGHRIRNIVIKRNWMDEHGCPIV